jgi:hypothetical protein
MKIDIQISDSNAAGLSPADSNEISPSTPDAANATDGGAPNVNKEGSSREASAGDTTDIGGPPRSLLESLESKQGDSPAVSATEETGQKQDGGPAPVV